MDIQTVFLKQYSSLRVGGEGKLVIAQTVEQLKQLIAYAKEEGLCAHILGGGTNSYFGEDLSQFLFIKLDMKGVEFKEEEEEVVVTAHASEIWDDVVQQCVERNLWGIENLSYIPGTVGAAPVQNIGAYGVELAEVFQSLDAYDVETETVVSLDRQACDFGYRDSIFKYDKGRFVIVSVSLRLSTKPKPVLLYKPLDVFCGSNDLTLQTIRKAVIEVRTKKLPNYHEYPNAGSFFKNPIVDIEVSEYVKNLYPNAPIIQVMEGYKVPAAWLIEHVAQMKGERRGEVGTWPNQPLVIVNYGGATADEIDQFAQSIQAKINTTTSIVLEREVNRVG